MASTHLSPHSSVRAMHYEQSYQQSNGDLLINNVHGHSSFRIVKSKIQLLYMYNYLCNHICKVGVKVFIVKG